MGSVTRSRTTDATGSTWGYRGGGTESIALQPITTASELTLWVGQVCSLCSGQLAVQPLYPTVAPYFLHFLPFILLVQDRNMTRARDGPPV